MDITPFPQKIEILDLKNLVVARSAGNLVCWPDQAIPLLGYMCHPADAAVRKMLTCLLRDWYISEAKQHPVPYKLRRIQADWRKVADIFQCYCNLIEGKHQERRGGPSIGKAVTLVAANAKSRGTAEANLWKLWSAYKDVAHLVTAALLVCSKVHAILRDRAPGQAELMSSQFMPLEIVWLWPDLILAVAKIFEDYGLRVIESRPEPAFDPDTVWRIPAEINVEPLPPPFSEIRPYDKVVLDKRRAGKRGRLSKTTPVSK
jgi:hypothetical protein